MRDDNERRLGVRAYVFPLVPLPKKCVTNKFGKINLVSISSTSEEVRDFLEILVGARH